MLCAGRLEGNSGAISTVARSYELQATLWAEWIVKQLNGKGRVAMLSGIAGVPTAEYQKTAAEKVFAQHPGIKVVAKEYTDWSPTKAKTVAATLVSKDLDAIWSDSGISDLGVVEAYQRAGKPIPPLTGDSSNAFLKAVDGKDVKFALSSFPPEQSTQCLDVALDALAGKKVPNVVNVESAAFTDAEIDKYIRKDCTRRPVDPDEPPGAAAEEAQALLRMAAVTADAVLEACGLGKAFPGVRALDGVDLVCRPGRVHALVGENGAGKSTLVRILTGNMAPDAGEIRVDGAPIRFTDPRQALAAGVTAVFQELTVLPAMSVVDNVMLGQERSRRGRLDRSEQRRLARAALARVGLGELDLEHRPRASRWPTSSWWRSPARSCARPAC